MVDKSKQVKVLYVLGSLSYGGLETWVMDIVRNIDRKEIQIDVCVTTDIKGEYEEEFLRNGGRILKCRLNKKNPFSFYNNFKKLLHKEKVPEGFYTEVLRARSARRYYLRGDHLCHVTRDGHDDL